MFVHILAALASWLRQKHYNSTHESHSGTAFICRNVMLQLYLLVVTSWRFRKIIEL